MTLQRWVGIIQGLFWLFLLSAIASIVGAVLLALNGQWAIALLVVWAGLVFGGLTALFRAIARAARQISALPKTLSRRQANRQRSPAPENEELLDTLMDIISDWNRLLETVGGLSLAQAYRLILIRLQALPAIMLAFLKGQRRRNYDSVLDSDRTVDFNVIQNFILTIRDRKSNADLDSTVLNGLTADERAAMAAIALDATRTPTTLWLDSEPETAKEQLTVLIACGQFTLCYQLLALVQDQDTSTLSPEMQRVRERAIAHWAQLKQNPKSLVR
jgi:ABC-type multidrug transport system fused ATPase/permease subunit